MKMYYYVIGLALGFLMNISGSFGAPPIPPMQDDEDFSPEQIVIDLSKLSEDPENYQPHLQRTDEDSSAGEGMENTSPLEVNTNSLQIPKFEDGDEFHGVFQDGLKYGYPQRRWRRPQSWEKAFTRGENFMGKPFGIGRFEQPFYASSSGARMARPTQHRGGQVSDLEFRQIKRSPLCLRRCFSQAMLHPIQCHSLC